MNSYPHWFIWTQKSDVFIPEKGRKHRFRGTTLVRKQSIAYLEHLITGMTRRCLHPTPEGASKGLEKVIAADSLLSGLEFSFYLSSINVLRPFIYRDYYLSYSIRQVFVTPPSRSINRVRRRGSSSCDAL